MISMVELKLAAFRLKMAFWDSSTTFNLFWSLAFLSLIFPHHQTINFKVCQHVLLLWSLTEKETALE
jgi:hypothetical protein